MESAAAISCDARNWWMSEKRVPWVVELEPESESSNEKGVEEENKRRRRRRSCEIKEESKAGSFLLLLLDSIF